MAASFIFRNNLYLGESMDTRKVGRLKRMLKKNPVFANLYVIIPAANPADQLDILDARQLEQPHYNGIQLEIVGMASNHSEALGVIEKIVRECLEARGDCNLREYLAC